MPELHSWDGAGVVARAVKAHVVVALRMVQVRRLGGIAVGKFNLSLE